MTAPGAADDPPASGAAPDRRLMISQRMRAPAGGTQTGQWAAAGAIDDQGTATITQTVVTPVPATNKALVLATHVLTSRDDPAQSMVLESRSDLRPFPPPPPDHRVLVEGEWELVSGTGKYANVRARGRLFATVIDGPVVNGQPTREITLVRDGRAR